MHREKINTEKREINKYIKKTNRQDLWALITIYGRSTQQAGGVAAAFYSADFLSLAEVASCAQESKLLATRSAFRHPCKVGEASQPSEVR